MLARLFPRELTPPLGAAFRLSLVLLGIFAVLKLVMGVNGIINTAQIAAGADGLPLDAYGPAAAGAVLMLFSLMSLAHVALALIAAAVIFRWRTMASFMWLILLAEHVARRFLIAGYDVERTSGGSVGTYVNLVLLGLLAAGFVLSLLRSMERA